MLAARAGALAMSDRIEACRTCSKCTHVTGCSLPPVPVRTCVLWTLRPIACMDCNVRCHFVFDKFDCFKLTESLRLTARSMAVTVQLNLQADAQPPTLFERYDLN